MLVILDRDGVINQYTGEYICSLADWHPLPGAIKAIARLCQAGHQVAVATNQSGVGRGYYSEAVLAQMHDRLCTLVSAEGGQIAHIAWCPHRPDQGCHCRKPGPGLLEAIRDALGLPDLAGSVMVGDSRSDLEAALRGGCQPYLVRTGNGRVTEAGLRQNPLPVNVPTYDHLAALVDDLLNRHGAVSG